MQRMLMPPGVEGGEGQHTCNKAHCLVGTARTKEGAMAAVVKYDEISHLEAGRDDDKREGEPVGNLQGLDHQDPYDDVRHIGIDDLPYAEFCIRYDIFGDDSAPFGLGAAGSFTRLLSCHDKFSFLKILSNRRKIVPEHAIDRGFLLTMKGIKLRGRSQTRQASGPN